MNQEKLISNILHRLGVMMNHKQEVHRLFGLMSDEVIAFINDAESAYLDWWVPAANIKRDIGLNKSAYPQGNAIDNETGWFFQQLPAIFKMRVKLISRELVDGLFIKVAVDS